MTILETAKITIKGQITIPNRIRKILHLKEGESVGFSVIKEGVVLVPCQVTAKSPYTPQEWKKIRELTATKGKSFKTADAAIKYVESL